MIRVKAFGKISDLIPNDCEIEINTTKVADLRTILEETFPKLKGMTYLVVANNEVISTDASMEDIKEIALLPPFSGG